MVAAVEGRPGTGYVTRVAAGAALGGFLFGYDTSTMNSAINGIRPTLDLGPGTVGFVAAVALIGCAVGAWFAGPLANRRGRNHVMSLAGAIMAAGALGAALSGHVVPMGLSRFAVGVGIGATSAVVPSYIAEVSPTRIRGRLGSFWQFAIVIGQFLGLLAGFGLTSWAGAETGPLPWGGAAWRWMFAAVAVLAAVYAVLVRRLPSTPHDLVRRGREAEAAEVLARVGGPEDASIEEIRRTVQQKSQVPTLADLRGPRLGLLPMVWTGILLAAFQQLVGINVVKTYSNTLWTAVGFSTSAAFTISLVTVGISIVSTVIAIAIMDKVNRRTMLATGAGFMALSLATLAVAFSRASGGEQPSLERGAAVAALVAINVFAVAFGITWGPVTWLMLGELFDSRLRTTAVAVCTAANWLTNWLVTRTFPLLAGAGLGIAYGLYAMFAVVALVFVLKFLPETRGRALS